MKALKKKLKPIGKYQKKRSKTLQHYDKETSKNTNNSYKTYDIVRNLIDLNHNSLLKNLFSTNYKIFEMENK